MCGCVFCQILAGNLPCKKVYEDDHVLVIHDINPQAPVHVLLICKEHIAGLDALTPAREALAGHMVLTAVTVASQLGLADGWRLVSNVGEHGRQSVPHLHMHILGGAPLTLSMA